MLTGVSLFAGVGGFDLAMQRQGIKVAASVEIDKNCNEVLAKHFPDAKQFTDVTTVKGKELIDAGFNPSSGIITGGFPCQDLSVAGKRAGLAGSRSGLFWEIARLVEETQTEYFVLENVPGLLSSNGGKDFGLVIGTMAELGYSVGWRVLDAQYFGVPQRRRRVFIVGRRATSGSVAEILFKSEGLSRDLAPIKQAREDLATNTTESFGQTGFAKYTAGVTTLTATTYKRPEDNVVVTSSSFGGYKEGVGTLRANGGDLGGGSENLIVFHPSYHDGARVQEKTMNTLTSHMGTGGNNVSMVAKETNVRRLTPIECERLQGFPDDWTAGQSDTNRYKQMGNAVAVPVVEWIVKGIVAAG